MRLAENWYLKVLAVVLILAISACAAMEEAEQQKEAQLKAAEVSMDINHIFIAAGDIPEAHDVLGKIEYSDPVTADSIEETTQDAKLRQLAMDRWPQDVDGIINVHREVNDAATLVAVSGTAIRIRPGPGVVCGPSSPLCRHKVEPGEAAAVAENTSEDREIKPPTIQPGDVWVNRVNGEDQTTKVLSVSGGRVVLSMGGKEAIVNPDLNLLSGFSIVAGQDVSYSPDLGTLSWPLRKGKHWTNHWRWKAEDYSGEGTTNGKAVGWETVTVPAGTFTALRIDVSYRSIVPANTTCWYLPDANTFAKCDITAAKKKTTIELVSYQPAGSTAAR